MADANRTMIEAREGSKTEGMARLNAAKALFWAGVIIPHVVCRQYGHTRSWRSGSHCL
jgi:hypothetical protein